MMKNNAWIRKALPHLVAIAVFALISFFYFKPQYEGMALRQGDMVQVEGMSRDIHDYKAAYNGEDPGWTGNMFGGMPSYLIDFSYEGRVIRDIGNELYILGLPASFLFLAMTGFYLMLLCFGVAPWLSIAGGIAYGLSTYFPLIIEAGHITKMVALVWAPPMVGAVYMAYRRNLWIGVALAGIFASLEIAANHLQITYYFCFVLLALVINEAIRAWKKRSMPRFVKTTAGLFAAALLAVASNAILLYYVNDYAKETIRGGSELTVDGQAARPGLEKDYVTAYSYQVSETFDLFIPNLMGGSMSGGFAADGPVADVLSKYNARQMASHLPGYWGEQPITSGPVYIGAVICFLFVLGMFLLRGRSKWWIAAVAALAVLLAWGHNLMWFTDLFYNYFPLYNKFRTVSMILVIVQWALPLLAVLGLQKLWSGKVEKAQFKKALQGSVVITGGIALIFALFGGSLFNFTGPADAQMGLPDDVLAAMRGERAAMLRADALRSLLFVLLTAGTVWAFHARKIKFGIFAVLAAVLVLVDLLPVDLRFVNHDSFVPVQAKAITATDADRRIMQDPDPACRVANLTVDPFRDATTSYYHRSIGGYHAAKLRRYQEVIERYLDPRIMSMEIYDMLNTKYFILPGEEGSDPRVQTNPGANGAAWFVDAVRWTDTASEELDTLDEINTRHEAVVDNRFRGQLDAVGVALPAMWLDESSDTIHRRAPRNLEPHGNDESLREPQIELTDYRVNHLTYKYSSPRPALAVFSEIYYSKGWTAYLDGEETPYLRADYILRAMALPAGEHTIVFHYAPPHYRVLAGVSYAGSILLLAGLLGVILIQKRKKKEGLR
ncbi:MAG: YfhO family protein [Rikenellaceae bacterium]|jgi:hypothetical protein|nr:YfhO family protein [Rikenellaceae bacterium]